MAQRDPNDPRCKDCPEPHEPNRTRCAACAERHRLAAAETRAARLKSKRCVVCGKAAAGGTTLCSAHRTYYRTRAARVASPLPVAAPLKRKNPKKQAAPRAAQRAS